MTTAATVMLVVTLPVRAAAMVVVAEAASALPPASSDPPLELPELLPEELPDPPELLELSGCTPESGAAAGDELLPHAKRRKDAIDATAREGKANE